MRTIIEDGTHGIWRWGRPTDLGEVIISILRVSGQPPDALYNWVVKLEGFEGIRSGMSDSYYGAALAAGIASRDVYEEAGGRGE